MSRQSSPLPTDREIDELIAFLPRLTVPGFKATDRWGGGEETESGAITLPWPEYNDIVEEFFAKAAEPCWSDYNYSSTNASAMVQDENAIKSATLADLKSMLTYCVRGERFVTGHWGAMIRDGVITSLLERLLELRAASESD